MPAISQPQPAAPGLLRRAWRELIRPDSRRIPVLDGLRALAILLVVNHHIAAAIETRFRSTAWTRSLVTVNGWMGVDLFFVLSGFFIGTQLWKELDRNGSIDLPAFMLRRTLRIWPLYFAVYFVALALSPHWGAAKQYGWADVVFLVNYFNFGVVPGGWSLSTEEQFYLFAPLVLLVIGRRSLRWYRGGLALLMLVAVGIRMATYVHFAGHLFTKNPDAFAHLYYPSYTHADGLFAGLFVANLALDQDRRSWLARHPWAAPVLGLSLFLVGWKLQSETLNFFGLAVFFGALVWFGVQQTPSFLGSWPFYFISRLSFGMYLIHGFLVGTVAAWIAPLATGSRWRELAAPAGFVLLTVLSLAISCVTFILIEHPFLELRTRLLRRRTKAAPLVAH